MNINTKIRTIEHEFTQCDRKLRDVFVNYKAVQNAPIRDKQNVIDNYEKQIAIYHSHRKSLRNELIKLYLVNR